ncbi:MAG: DnaK suppressor protein [Actinomycetota bacterium]|jgi:DnaK suppressor protein|nr:DnaK suppressor protein [Actinomycetota bacterium]
MPDVAGADLRVALEQERDHLVHQLEEIGSLNYDSNFADSSQVTAERGETEALAASLRDALEDVEHALAKHTDGTYGLCETCGKPIATTRLEAMPTARSCIDCASKR